MSNSAQYFEDVHKSLIFATICNNKNDALQRKNDEERKQQWRQTALGNCTILLWVIRYATADFRSPLSLFRG